MKKILLSVVCLVVGIQCVMAQVAICALHHEGNVTIYSAAGLQTAIDNAVAGDTIYLSEGAFGGFNVTKPIAIIGAGQTTSISGMATIGSNSGNMESGLLLNGLCFISDLTFNGLVNGARISQCKISGTTSITAAEDSGIEILHTQMGSLVLGNGCNVKELSVVSSKISEVSGFGKSAGSVNFVNCNIGESENGDGETNNVYNNCIIEDTHTAYHAGYGTYVNCLLPSGDYSSNSFTLANCYQTSSFSLDDDLNCSMSDSELQSNGYLGTDGKVVGITGGDSPFTLVMPFLQVVEHSYEVDQAERKLRVNLRLGNK